MVTFAISSNYHGNIAPQPIKSNDSGVVAIGSKVTTNGKFYATGPRVLYSFMNYVMPIKAPMYSKILGI